MPFNAPQTAIPRKFGPLNWHPHYEAALNWVLLNPHRNDSEGAAELGFTNTWFSLIINSNTFQARLSERASEMGVEIGLAAQGIYGKMLHAANLAMDRTVEKLETRTASESFITSSRDNILGHLGYAKGQPVQNSVKIGTLNINAEAIREGRALLQKLGGSEVVDVTPEPQPLE